MPNTGVLKNLRRVDLSLCDEANSFLQSGFWGRFKSRFGWEAHSFCLDWVINKDETLYETKTLLLLRRKFLPGFSMIYIPWGPELPASFPDSDYEAAITELSLVLKENLPKDTVFLRFDLPWLSCDKPFFFSSRLKRSLVDIQVPDTVILDLTQPIESLKLKMKAKWRYNAGLAIKKGVKVKLSGVQNIDTFYKLLEITSSRDGLFIHEINYYKTIFECLSKTILSIPEIFKTKIDLRLYIAEFEENPLACIIILLWKKEAIYLYGASSNENRNLMASYALQMKAIEDAKEFGCETYDLFGIPPEDNPSNPMSGLYLFKTGFGGSIYHRPGCYDYPCKNFLYFLYQKIEFLRKKIMNFKKKR